MSTTEKPKPVETLRDGRLKATIWRNFGDNGTFYSVEISRTYKDGDDYKNAHSYSGAELLKVSRLSLKAYDRVGDFLIEDEDRANAA